MKAYSRKTYHNKKKKKKKKRLNIFVCCFQDDQPFFFKEFLGLEQRPNAATNCFKFVINFFLGSQTSPPLRVKQEFAFHVNYVKSLSM